MHSRYAAVFGIENLELNQYFRPEDASTQTCANQPLTLNKQLLADIQRAATPIVINSVIHSAELQLQDEQLGLVNNPLSVDDKRALWALMSEQLDKL
jgi:hypothetical protein